MHLFGCLLLSPPIGLCYVCIGLSPILSLLSKRRVSLPDVLNIKRKQYISQQLTQGSDARESKRTRIGGQDNQTADLL